MSIESRGEAVTADSAILLDVLRGVLDRHGGQRWSVRPDQSWCGVGSPTAVVRKHGWKLPAGGKVGIGTATPSHALHAVANTGIRQNAMYVSGNLGWSSLSYNAFHNETNTNWVFPVPGRTAATVELDDNGPGGSARFQVFTTTNANPLGWQLRLGIHGNTGEVTIPGRITGGENASVAGDMLVRGILKAAVKMFTIDHPLDPANRVLNHASVESDERAVQYQGNVILGDDGTATVELPGWLEALAADFRYQLTCVGGYANVFIAEKIRDNREDKPEQERGVYLHPQVHATPH